MADETRRSRFQISLDELEKGTRVPRDEQVESQPDEVDPTLPQLPENVREAIRWAGG